MNTTTKPARRVGLFSSLLFSSLLFSSLLLILLTATSCQKDDLPGKPAFETPPAKEGMIKLGRKIENPYTVENMRKAYENLVQQGKLKSGLVIDPTHHYIRFLPADMEQFDLLEADTNLVLFEYPLDYVIHEGGTFYFDPELDPAVHPFTWQYVVVPVNYRLPGMQTEKISDLVLNLEAVEKSTATAGDIWEQIETEALSITGNLCTEENRLKLFRPRWTPSGTITVWDDILNRQIPLAGVRVRARWLFFWHEGITCPFGHFRVNGTFRQGRNVHYTIRWQNHLWQIVDFNFEAFGWWQTIFNGPTQNTDWHQAIGFHGDRNRSLRYATIHRALRRYFHCQPHVRLGLQPPFPPGPPLQRVKVGYDHDGFGRSNALPGLPWLIGRPHVEIQGRQGLRQPHSVFAVTIHELAHVSHMRIMGEFAFGNVWANPYTRIIPESWAEALEWGLTNLEYHALGRFYEHSGAIAYDHGNWQRRWDRHGDRHYTPLFIDLVDTVNQRLLNNGDPNYPNDNVSGFTWPVLELIILPEAHGLLRLRNRLKMFKPEGITDRDIDDLIDFYQNL